MLGYHFLSYLRFLTTATVVSWLLSLLTRLVIADGESDIEGDGSVRWVRDEDGGACIDSWLVGCCGFGNEFGWNGNNGDFIGPFNVDCGNWICVDGNWGWKKGVVRNTLKSLWFAFAVVWLLFIFWLNKLFCGQMFCEELVFWEYSLLLIWTKLLLFGKDTLWLLLLGIALFVLLLLILSGKLSSFGISKSNNCEDKNWSNPSSLSIE